MRLATEVICNACSLLSVFFIRFEVSQLATPTELLAMPALSSLKSNRTRAKTALAKEEAKANTLLQRELTEQNEHREIDHYLLSISKVILNLATKLACLETANEKLIDALEQSEETTSAEEFQFTLDEDAELNDEVIDKLSQLKLLKKEVEK